MGVGLRSAPPGLLGGAPPQRDAKQFDPVASLGAGVDPDRALGLILAPINCCWILLYNLNGL